MTGEKRLWRQKKKNNFLCPKENWQPVKVLPKQNNWFLPQNKLPKLQVELWGEKGGGGKRLMRLLIFFQRCALEWEFLANCIDRCLLAFFACMTAFFFSLLAFYERWIELGLHFG
uniref:Uncharacterized protein n=1 Tax=Meloidogyne enterolobii TaxID=390850 RepID=A0A6V7VK66_MELEN|nr:unnamed protein product [Meloidogyne enterolobii]